MNQQQVTPEQMAKIKAALASGRGFLSPAELLAPTADPETAAALGGETTVGDLTLHLSVAHLPLLQLIRSPLVAPVEAGDTEATLIDVAMAVYALGEGKTLATPLLAVERQRKALAKLAAESRDAGAVYYQAYLDAVCGVEKQAAAIEADALAYYAAHCQGHGPEEVLRAVLGMLGEAMAPFSRVGGGGDDSKPRPMTPSGSGKSSTSPGGRFLARLWTIFCGGFRWRSLASAFWRSAPRAV